MRTRYKTYADYGMLKSDEEKTRERCMKASAEERLIILQCVISAAPGLEMAIYDRLPAASDIGHSCGWGGRYRQARTISTLTAAKRWQR